MTIEGDVSRAAIVEVLREQPGIKYRDLARAVGLDLSTVHGHVRRLIQYGWLERTTCPHCHRPTLEPTQMALDAPIPNYPMPDDMLGHIPRKEAKADAG